MSRRKLTAGSTSQAVPIFVQDTSSATGAGLGSLVYNTAGLAAKYRRQGDAAWTTITLATMIAGTWASGGFVSDGGPVTGTYEVGIPNAILAASAGVTWAEVVIYGAANMLPILLEFELDTLNYQASGGKFPATLVAADLATDAVTKIQLGLMTSAGYTTPPTVGAISTQVGTDLSTAHGAGAWSTATGFSQPGDAMALTTSERNTLSTSIWSYTTRTLSAFSFTVGTSPVTLAASQANYAPAKAGDAMTLTTGERTTLAGVFWNSLDAVVSVSGSIGSRIVSFLTGDAFARLGAPSGASHAADVSAVKSDTTECLQHARSDYYIDDGVNPFEIVHVVEGTDTELTRKQLFTVAGDNVDATTDIPGKALTA